MISLPQRYDVVVIGAGLGGLTAAALLARSGRKVLLLERNPSIGGAASTYKIKDLVVEGALHQTGDPRDPRDPKHEIFQRLGILNAIEWVPTRALYHVRGGPLGAPFLMPDNFPAARDTLTERFPAHRTAIAEVLADMERAGTGAGSANDRPRSVADVFDRAFDGDEAIKCALAANLACHHDDPRTLSWPFFAAAQGGYLACGPRFIRGGSQRLSNALR